MHVLRVLCSVLIMDAGLKERWLDYTQKGSLSGVDTFKKGVKASRAKVKEALRQIPSYNLHRPAYRTFPRRRVHVSGIHEQYAMDLKDIQKSSRFNNKKKFLLVVIDSFSKMAFIEAIPNKTAPVVTNALEKILARSGGVPRRINVDRGTEFLNRTMQAYLKKKGIDIFWTYSPLKSVIIERFIRTLFQKIQRYMTHNNTRRFVNKLDDFERLYNNSYHRSIKMAPSEVTKENEQEVYNNIYPIVAMDYTPPKLKICDTVLLARNKKTFEKGYTKNYLDDVYIVAKVVETIPRTYKLQS